LIHVPSAASAARLPTLLDGSLLEVKKGHPWLPEARMKAHGGPCALPPLPIARSRVYRATTWHSPLLCCTIRRNTRLMHFTSPDLRFKHRLEFELLATTLPSPQILYSTRTSYFNPPPTSPIVLHTQPRVNKGLLLRHKVAEMETPGGT
jgi:hypothetical protein